MTLVDISAADAVATRKTNQFATWGDRAELNRVEPLAKPNFDAPFKLRRGEPIFTVGSCFARNVEVELLRRGLRVPMRDLFKLPDFVSLDPSIINNFGTPSIYNEFSWALGETEFVPEDHILEIAPGRFVDLHLIPSLRPDSWAVAMRRRAGIVEAFRTVAECRVMIVTLGLVELWFDAKTGYYLNAQPRPSLVRAEPDRYRLHVLSYEDALDYLNRTLTLIRARANPDIQVLLTVSPVPMMATHRPQDVMVANMYSKSVLRTVAETICATNDSVTYFPSYESVTLSDRLLAWHDDMTHVQKSIVALNVGRMVEAFIESDGDAGATSDDDLAQDPAKLVEKAAAMRIELSEQTEAFFDRFASHDASSAAFALEHAGYLAAFGRHVEALATLDKAPPKEAEERVALARAASQIALARAEEAFALMSPRATQQTKSFAIWNTLLNAACGTGDAETVAGVLFRWSRAQPTRIVHAYTVVGRWHLERGELREASSHFEHAISLDPTAAIARIHLTEALIALGRSDDARYSLSLIQPDSAREKKLYDRLVTVLG